MHRSLSALLILSACSRPVPSGDDGVPPPGLSPLPGTITDGEVVELLEAPRPQVDLLFVLDTSPSMVDEAALLAQTGPLVSGALDPHAGQWRVGVVEMDMFAPGGGELAQAQGRRWVDWDMPDRDALLAELFDRGNAGSAQTSGRDATYTALVELDVPGGANEGFHRGEWLHLIFVTDSDDESTAIQPEPFKEWLAGMDGLVGVSSVVTPPNGCPWSADPGESYLELTLEFGGVAWDICDADLLTPLETLPVAPHVDGLLHLRAPASQATLSVQHLRGDGTTVVLEPGEWTYDPSANAVQVDPLAGWGPEDLIRVAYTPLDPT